MNKQLYVVTARSVVYAKSKEQAEQAIYARDPLDLFIVGEGDIAELTSLEDVPFGWAKEQCVLDAEVSASAEEADPWTIDSIEGILKRKNNPTVNENHKIADLKCKNNPVFDENYKIAELIHKIALLEKRINALEKL